MIFLCFFCSVLVGVSHFGYLNYQSITFQKNKTALNIYPKQFYFFNNSSNIYNLF